MTVQAFIKTYRTALGVVVLLMVLSVVGYWLGLVLPGQVVLQQELQLGPLSVRYYGLMLAVAATAGYVLARVLRPYWLMSVSDFDEMFLYLVIGGFVGARLYHVITDYQLYLSKPIETLYVWQGGLGIYGAVVGGVIALIMWSRKRHIKLPGFLTLLDTLVPAVALGQAIGRFGNLFNYELYGSPTSLPWALYVPARFRDLSVMAFEKFHPLFLYESVWMVAVAFGLTWLVRQEKTKPGQVFFIYLFLYTVARLVLEFFRIQSVFWGHIRINAFISAVLALMAIILYFYVKKLDKTTTPVS